jgi:hypothetical protein
VQRLIASDVVCYDAVNVQAQTDTWLCRPADALTFPDSHDIFQQHMAEHPVIAYHAATDDTRVLTLSDFVSQRQLHDLGLYQDFFRLVGTEYQISCVVASSLPMVIGLVLNRPDRDFTERERTLLTLAAPHLVQAHANAKAISQLGGALAALTRAFESTARGAIVVTRAGVVQSCGVVAERWLQIYFDRPRGSTGLPARSRRGPSSSGGNWIG